jgi:hypothetical protein
VAAAFLPADRRLRVIAALRAAARRLRVRAAFAPALRMKDNLRGLLKAVLVPVGILLLVLLMVLGTAS